MATAVADEQLVSRPDTKLLFMCRRRDLRLVRTPRYPVYGASGQKVGEKPGEVLAFRDGVLRVPADGKVVLEDGREVDAASVVEWLESHRLNGDIEEGFWRVDEMAPPPSADELRALMNAAMRLDVATLEAIIAQEELGWQRPGIIDPARESLEQITQALASREPDPEPESEPKPRAKK